MPLQEFQRSNSPLITATVANIMKKDSKWIDYFVRVFGWQDAFGLRQKLRNNGGIYQNKSMSEACQKVPPPQRSTFSLAQCATIGQRSAETPLDLPVFREVGIAYGVGILAAILVFVIEYCSKFVITKYDDFI